MKHFAKLSACFLCGLILLALLLEVIARSCPSTYAYKAEWMEQHADEVETLVLGPSTTYNCIKPELLSTKAFNLANSYQTNRYDWFLLSRDSTRYRKLKNIIYPTSALLMNTRLEDGVAWYRSAYYRNYFGCQDHSLFSKYAWEIFCCAAVQNKLSKYNEPLTCDSLGFGIDLVPGPDNLKELTPQKVASRVKWVVATTREKTMDEDYIGMMLDYCQRHDIRVYLLNVPEYPSFFEALDSLPVIQQQMNAKVEEILAKYDNVIYRDYQGDARFDSLDFANPNHLNIKGAEKFTQILREELSL